MRASLSPPSAAGALLASLLGLGALASLSGCATQAPTGFHRARRLQPGHMEIGGSVSMARLPAEGTFVTRKDEGQVGEPSFGFPAPSVHFRMGVAPALDLALEAAPGGVKLGALYGIVDDDSLMMGAGVELGFWASRLSTPPDDELAVDSPLFLGFHVPIATRPRPWLELNVAPVIGVAQYVATRQAYLEEQERSFMSLQSGFRIGANFSVWRVRIAPEVALLGVYRSDRDEGFAGIYPGVGAFIVY